MESLYNFISLQNKRLFQNIHSSSGIMRIKIKKMKTELILKSDVLDILFENRNKAYGAYMLRKFYDDRLKKSIAIMTVLVCIFSALAFIPNKKNKNTKVLFETTVAT